MGISEKSCVPCQAGGEPMTREAAQAMLAQTPEWLLSEDGLSIHRRFPFKNFIKAMSFAVKTGEQAEREGHHPVITIGWGFCLVVFKTAKIKGLHENDFIMAAKVNALFEV